MRTLTVREDEEKLSADDDTDDEGAEELKAEELTAEEDTGDDEKTDDEAGAAVLLEKRHCAAPPA